MNSINSWINPNRALTAYAVIFSTFIVCASLRSAMNPAPHGLSIQYLAVVEVIGAILFSFRRTRFPGLAILLAVFAIAATIEFHLHELPLRFVFYAASALFVQYLSIQPNQLAKCFLLHQLWRLVSRAWQGTRREGGRPRYKTEHSLGARQRSERKG